MATSGKSLDIAVIGIKGIPARYGGFETCADETCRRLVRMGHKVTVYCRRGVSETRPVEYEGITLRYVPCLQSKSLATISSSFVACLLVMISTAHVVHLYTVGTALFVPLLRLCGKRTVVSVDALDWKRTKWSRFAKLYMQCAAYIAVRLADELVIDSKVIQDYYGQRFARRGAYVPFGANTEPYQGSDALREHGIQPRKYFLFVGILRAEKRVDDLVRAFNEVARDGYELVILGDNPLETDYVEYVKALAGPGIRFLGRIYGSPFVEVCQNAYAYITCSEIEGTSPALLSAMGAGCCVLVNGIPENLETIGDAGVSYRKNDIQDLKDKVTFLIQHPDAVADYGRKARERVLAIYSWDKVASDFESIYRRTLSRPRAHQA